jgi:aryl-alcohol dehydrogenase-like predicted oxidoreductase
MTSTIKLGDLSVNRLGFGAMRVCGPDIWGPPQDRRAARWTAASSA